MCGIFGYISKEKNPERDVADKILRSLYLLSETRGKEASGLYLVNDIEIQLVKDAIPASQLIKRQDYKRLTTALFQSSAPICAIGHSRLVTNGQSHNNENNQPIFASGMVAVHNGIITNDQDIWGRNSEIERKYEIDTEVFLRLFRKNLKSLPLLNALKHTYKNIEGVANIATIFEDLNSFLLATNNGSLYILVSNSGSSIIFASERYIVDQCIKKNRLYLLGFDSSKIEHIGASHALLVNLKDLKISRYNFFDENNIEPELERKTRDVIDFSTSDGTEPSSRNTSTKINYDRFYQEYEKNKVKISSLKRCTKCILPETMPFISFDDEGVCNYCKEYVVHKPKGLDALKKVLPKTSQSFDCLVTLSGGRDSSYGLHYIKKNLGLNPVSYTYDWGMVTDLARRNQMRMCGALGVEHILVSADIQKKRDNIKKNVSAWLKRPELGMIPLFMAGDKQYFYWSNRIAEQTKVQNIILCENLLETTRFKSGFCGIEPIHGTGNTYTLSLKNKLQMLFYYVKNFIKNPSYLNSSLADTFSAFSSYYVMKHNFTNLFDYIEWNEEEINQTLIREYNWEISNDTDSTWRIGDGTAAFYNYIYYTLSGMTENDSFRSNQIRQGQITREKAIELSGKENKPRFESIKWYLETIGLDFEPVLDTIYKAKKLY